MWKIIQTDRYDRKIYPEVLVADNIEWFELGELMIEALRNNPKRADDIWYKLVPEDYKLWRGMEDLV